MLGNKRRLVALGAAAVILIGAAGAVLLLGRSRGAPSQGTGYERAGAAVSAGLDKALELAGTLREPHRCAELGTYTPPVGILEIGERSFTRSTHTLIAKPHRRGRDRLIIGAVSDARGGDALTMKQLASARRVFEKRGVELVLSLGGMGADREALIRVLSALVRNARWVVVAIPGARESLPAHREAIAAVAAPGLLDGSQIRTIEMDGAVIGTYPGVEIAGRLHAGADGCTHQPADAIALAADLAAREGVKIWASYAPPRQRGERASDVGVDGIHVGERSMTTAVKRSGAALVVHGQVDQAALGSRRGRHALATGSTLHLASGPIEAMPVSDGRDSINGSAVVITIRGRSIEWERIRF